MTRNWIKQGAIIAFCILSFLAGWFGRGFRNHNETQPESYVQTRADANPFALTNPLLDCEMATDTIGKRELVPFKNDILKLTSSFLATHKQSDVSVYFRDLNNGPWFGINEKHKFAPASLLKVPIMIAYLKQAESNPLFLTKKIPYEEGRPDFNTQLTIQPSETIKPGNSYTIEELIHHAIVFSDNNANDLLFRNMDIKYLEKTYRELGLTPPYANIPADYMSAKEYGAVFRILFNATYLSREMSEKALMLLTEVEYRQGFASAVPASITTAHKFGERVFQPDNNLTMLELHDCGIIYYPKSPYLLCIMTRGQDFEALNDLIGNIAHLIYEEVNDHFLKIKD